MKLRNITLLLSFFLLSYTSIFGQTVTLTDNNSFVIVEKKGTVTFSGPGLTLERVAQQNNLKHISGQTYQAAIIYGNAFSKGYVVARGKIYNCTDKNIIVNCAFYNGYDLIYSHKVSVKARTFNRMLPEDIDLSTIKNCDRIVCSEQE